MVKYEEIYADILSGKKDANIKFRDLCELLDKMGFKCSVRGDHYIYRRNDTPIVNIQPDGNKAKSYQVRQIRNIILQCKLEV